MPNNTTPSNLDGFSRFFANAFDENDVISVFSGFLAIFARRRPFFRTDANVVDIDIVRGNEKHAKFIVRGTVGEYLKEQTTKGGKYTNFSRQFPLSEETENIDVEDISDRMAGENPFAAKSRRERMRDSSIDGFHKMVGRTIRAWEIAAAQVMLTGTQPTILGNSDPDFLLDYKRNTDLIETLLAGEQFDGAADPLAVIDAKIDKLKQIGKVSGEFTVVMGAETIIGFFGNTKIKDAGDNRRLVTVVKNPDLMAPQPIRDMIAGGMTYIAMASTNKGRKIHILTYDAWYDTDAGVSTPYMPDKSMLIMPFVFRADRYFGPGDTLPMNSLDMRYLSETFGITPRTNFSAVNIKAAPGVIDPRAFYTDAFPGGARKSAVLRVQTAPIFATTQTDAIFTGNAVVS